MLESAYEHLPYSSSELEHRYGEAVHILSEPCLMTQLARLCEGVTTQPEVNALIEFCYRGLLERIINLEFPRRLITHDTRMIEHTDRGRFHGEVLDPETAVVTVDIARAGMFPSHICFQMLNELLDPSRVRQDHLVMNRIVDDSGQVTGAGIYGSKVGGDVADRIVIFPDPMAATGSSMVRALEHYREHVAGTPRKIILAHLIVTPEYIRALRTADPDAVIYAIRLDRGLSEPRVLATVPGTHWDEECGLSDRQYIVPGGGGFGEILNNAEF